VTGILFLGFLIGMRHALETDHVAAVAVLTTRAKTLRQALPMGMMWGVGHTLTLFAFGSAVLFLNAALSDGLARFLEAAVGVMLIGLGGDVIVRLIRQRIHFHTHRHDNNAVHLHAHSHSGDGAHEVSKHQHQHPARLPRRALLVGMMHGMAGSSALVLLTAHTVDSVTGGLAYIGLFGAGSIIGMGMLTAVIVVPLKFAATSMTWAYGTLTGILGAFSVGIGLFTVFHSAFPA